MKTPDSERDDHDKAWDDLFRQRLGEYTDQPPADALNRILAAANPPRPYRRWIAGGVAAMLLLGAGGWLALHQSIEQSRVVMPTVAAHRPARPVSPATTAMTPLPTDKPVTYQPETLPKAKPDPLLSKAATDRREEQRNTVDPAAVVDQVALTRAAVKTQPDRMALALPAATNRRPTATHQDRIAGQLQQRNITPNGLDYGLSKPNRQADVGKQATYNPALTRQTVTADGSAESAPAIQTLRLMAARPFRAFSVTTSLPGVLAAAPAASQSSRPNNHPSWLVSLTPLYNYQQIDPIHTDNELVSNIRGAQSLAADRIGGRLQLGLEWPLTRRLRLRTSLVYQQVRQVLHYAVRSVRPDSVQVVVVDNQSVQVTPVFTEHNYGETTVWHYAGLSTDAVWQLNRLGRWQHYLTAGATVGRYVNRPGAVSGFVQSSYGFERPLTASLRLRVEPSVQLGWQTLTDRSQRLQSRPYGYGVLLGLRFR